MEYTNPTGQTDNPMNNVRDLQTRAGETLEQAGRRWNDATSRARDMVRDAAQYTERQMQQNPWTALSIGFGAGVVMGALLMLAAGPKR